MTPASLRSRKGFLLLEVLLGIAIFAIFLGAAGLTMLYGQESTAEGGDQTRGLYAAERALEASRAIRDGGFAGLTAGKHGVALGSQKTWVFSGSSVTLSGGYVTSVSVSSVASNWVSLTATTKWKHGYNRSGSILLTTDLTDWHSLRSTGDWSSPAVEGSYIDGGNPLFSDMAVSGNYLFASSDITGGGAGLYIFDISNTAAPARVDSSFNLGVAAYQMEVRGKILYILTGDPAKEVRAYDISSPSTLSSANLIASYDLPGSGLGLSMALRGSNLYVGAQATGTNQFYSFTVSDTGSLTLLSALPYTNDVTGIALSGTGAYLSTANVGDEMKVVNIVNPANLSFAANGDYNVTGSQLGDSVAATGTSALLGRQKGATQNFTLFDTRNGGGSPPPAPGPWYYDGSGSMLGVSLDATGCYGFLAGDSSNKALQVIKLTDHTLPMLASYQSSNGPGRAVFYDVVRDRVYLLTKRALIIFKPGSSSTATCP